MVRRYSSSGVRPEVVLGPNDDPAPTGGGAADSPCLEMQLRHGVHVGRVWGTLSKRDQLRWTRLGCDQRVNR